MAAITLKIYLTDIEPKITRTVTVSSDSSMYLLHHIIQEAMGWKNYHLYHFKIKNLHIGDLRLLQMDGYDGMEMNPVDGKEIMVGEIFTAVAQTIDYVYDYGDYWKHKIELVEINHKPQQLVLPVLVSGTNACPPEDCGGSHGYEELKKVLKNVHHADYIQMLTWVGADFNPEKFNKKTVVKNLAKLNDLITNYEKGFLK
jgi:hypothetical protein